MAYQVVAIIKGGSGDHEFRSPSFDARQDAEAEITALREQQERALAQPGGPTLTDRAWLSVDARLIVGVYITGKAGR